MNAEAHTFVPAHPAGQQDASSQLPKPRVQEAKQERRRPHKPTLQNASRPNGDQAANQTSAGNKQATKKKKEPRSRREGQGKGTESSAVPSDAEALLARDSTTGIDNPQTSKDNPTKPNLT